MARSPRIHAGFWPRARRSRRCFASRRSRFDLGCSTRRIAWSSPHAQIRGQARRPEGLSRTKRLGVADGRPHSLGELAHRVCSARHGVVCVRGSSSRDASRRFGAVLGSANSGRSRFSLRPQRMKWRPRAESNEQPPPGSFRPALRTHGEALLPQRNISCRDITPSASLSRCGHVGSEPGGATRDVDR
jgi:hypothetical protein